METLIIWPFDLETSHFVNTHTLSLLFINTYFLYCKVMRASTTSSKHCNLMEKHSQIWFMALHTWNTILLSVEIDFKGILLILLPFYSQIMQINCYFENSLVSRKEHASCDNTLAFITALTHFFSFCKLCYWWCACPTGGSEIWEDDHWSECGDGRQWPAQLQQFLVWVRTKFADWFWADLIPNDPSVFFWACGWN